MKASKKSDRKRRSNHPMESGAAGGGVDDDVRVRNGGADGSSASRFRTLISTGPFVARRASREEVSLLEDGERKLYELHIRVAERGQRW